MTTEKKPEAAKESRNTITVTLEPSVYEAITKKAAEDDRTPAKWLARYIKSTMET